jgi:hypothetical protein
MDKKEIENQEPDNAPYVILYLVGIGILMLCGGSYWAGHILGWW